jgi:hypothetical protein
MFLLCSTVFAECAEKCLSEDERAALACVSKDLPLAARMVAAQKPAVKSVVVLKKEVSGHDPDFLSVIHNQLAKLPGTKDGTAAGYSFVRSVLKEASPGNQFEMLLVTQFLAVHDATMSTARLLGEAKTLEHVNSYGNLFNKLARTSAAQIETLQRLRLGNEQKVTVQNVSVTEGGQAIVGNVTHNSGGSGTTESAKPPLSPSDQSGTGMTIIQPDEQLTMAGPSIEPNEQPAPTVTKRMRRA